MASNKEKILSYIKENGQATVNELLDILLIERAMIHRHLKSMVEAGVIRKIGSAPKVWYVPVEKKKQVLEIPNIPASATKIINSNFLLITPQGERLDGVAGFVRWCADRRYDIIKRSSEYEALYKKYVALEENGLLDGTLKMRDTFGDDCRIDKTYYVDFYAWEIFGKTKLGQLLLYAKQSQNRKMIKEVIDIIHPCVNSLIKKHNINAVGYIPPTVKRTIQIMDVIKKNLRIALPEIKLTKAVGEVRVPQKTLSKLQERVDNARETIMVSGNKNFSTVLLIDDAVGSGATMNETARKLKNHGIAGKVIGLAIIGSLKGFDVISEI